MTEDKPKFTPGPWQIIPEDQAIHRWVIGAMDGGSIASCDPVGPWLSDDEATANAHAISAVPDMYKALKMAQLWLDIDGRYDMRTINAAINKAEGRQA